MKRFIACLCWTLFLGATAQGQVYFGKNKIQYTDFDWHILQTEHFQIYFYSEEKWLAEVAARAAESSYQELRIKFQHHIFSRVPIIVYSSANHFSETNVVSSFLPEAVGGFTEFFKGRVALPFTGSYADFRRILQHELVHVFTYSKLDYVLRLHHPVNAIPPPLWWIEGLAEHWSRPWGPAADLVMRQMVLEDHLVGISDMYRIHGSFYMYKVGESILEYWAERFGESALTRMFDNWPRAKSFAQLVEMTFGVPLARLDKDWAYRLKKRYYPQFEALDLPMAVARPVSPDGFYLSPTPICVPNKDSTCDPQVVYLGNQLGYSALYGQADGTGKPKALVKGGRSGRMETLHLYRAGIDASCDGRVAFSSKSNGRDVLFFYDLKSHRIVDERKFDHLISISSPGFSSDGHKVVFSGAGIDGRLDLYMLDLRSQDPPQRLTHDHYRDIDPVISPDGLSVVFASDRGQNGKEGGLNLFRLELSTGQMAAITATDGFNSEPAYGGPDTLYFVSDRDGSFDVYALVDDARLYRVTSLSSGALGPRVDRLTGDLLFSAHTNFGYRVYRTEIDPTLWTSVTLEPTGSQHSEWQVDRTEAPVFASTDNIRKYRNDFSIDIAQSAISYDAVYGTLGGFQLAVSDLLGNELYHVLISNPANTSADLLTSFNVAIAYLNRENRTNYGWGLFHLYDENFNFVDGLYRERQAGGLLYASYALSKFRRVELSSFIRYSKREWLTPPDVRQGILATPTLSLVYDNSLWEVTGPIEGIRANVSAGITYLVNDNRVISRTAWADLRHYYRMGRESSFATRLYAYLSGGDEPERRYFGGSWEFRGYARHEFFARKILFASNELRFPLIHRLALDSPFGRLNFRGIRGVLFADVGALYERDTPDWRGSYGFGWRMALGGLMVLRFDFAKTTDFKTIDPGLDFDFFFGWNF